jgi:long-chain acyl-CoA synthetase
MHMVPTMFVRLLQLPDAVKRRYDLCSLRHVIHGAAPCATETKRAMLDWWGPVINEYYGSTEASISTYLTSTEALAKLGTVGRPLRCVTIRVYDEQGRQVPPGTVGEIYVRLEGYSDFTYHGQDAMRREIERDGLISVGDVGYLDADGYLFLCDRKRDMVISGGVNIYPAEIEAVLIGMPGVRDCALFGIPHAEFGETLCACIQLKPGAQLDARSVRAYLKPRIANYKIPSVVEFHDELPREDSGKIFKRRLRDPYWQGTGRRI